jgi:hypothetical protein
VAPGKHSLSRSGQSLFASLQQFGVQSRDNCPGYWTSDVTNVLTSGKVVLARARSTIHRKRALALRQLHLDVTSSKSSRKTSERCWGIQQLRWHLDGLDLRLTKRNCHTEALSSWNSSVRLQEVAICSIGESGNSDRCNRRARSPSIRIGGTEQGELTQASTTAHHSTKDAELLSSF